VEGDMLRVISVQEDSIAALRGRGKGGAVKRLLAERAKDRLHK